jgi:hypothetical protein
MVVVMLLVPAAVLRPAPLGMRRLGMWSFGVCRGVGLRRRVRRVRVRHRGYGRRPAMRR